jgi:precorrin-2 dehydrogenase / sirohydrochlorin ferrochelatase
VYFPVAWNLKGRKALVIGGGAEATRKVRALLECEARVTVVSPGVSAEIEQFAGAGRVTLVEREYREGDLDGVSLAIVCDPALGERARAEADRRGVLLNVVDRPALCDFIAVATFSRDGLQFGVHTSGKSGALARRIRERLQLEFGEPYGELTRVLGALRPAVARLIPGAAERRRFWLDVVDAGLLERIDGGVAPESLREEILRHAETLAREIAPTSAPDQARPDGAR